MANQRNLSSLSERYFSLPPGPKLVLQLKSLICFETTKTVFLECLTRSGLRAPDGRAWNSVGVNAALDRLQADGLLTETLICSPGLMHAVAVDALASAKGAQMVAAVRHAFAPPQRSFPTYASPAGQVDVVRSLRLGRLALYANEPAALQALESDHAASMPGTEKSLVVVLGELLALTEFSTDWLESRDPAIQVALLSGRVAALLTGVAGIPGIAELLDRYRVLQDQPGFAPVRRPLLDYAVMALRLDEARALLGAVQTDPPDPALQGVAATLDFLAGHNDAAIAGYRAALKARRKQTGKRKLFLDGVHGPLFLMALLRANDTALHADIQAGIDVLPLESRPYPGAWIALQMLLWLAQGLEAKAREQLRLMQDYRPADPFTAACFALAAHAVDPEQAHRQADHVAKCFAATRDLLPLPARMCAEVLVDLEPGYPDYAHWLEATGAGIGVSFRHLLAVSAPWERALGSLDTMLFATAKPAREAPPRKAKRLAWFVNPDTLLVDVVEQSPKGRDGWSDGRPVALKRLFEHDPRLDYLTEADRAAIRSIRRERTGWSDSDYSYDFDSHRTLPALVGHPTVFDARMRHQPIELVSYPVELVISEHRAGYRLALSHTAEQPRVFLEAESAHRYRVIEVTEGLFGVQQILGPAGLVVPAAARDRIVGMVRRDNASLPIRAEIAALDSASDGVATPVVQLRPQGAAQEGGDPAEGGGLKATLLVRPFGATGPAYVAGLGGRSVLATIDGVQCRVRRDPDAEIAARAALVRACPTLLGAGALEQHEVAIDGLQPCLELMLELQAQNDHAVVVVEWPQGGKLVVHNVDAGRVRLRVREARDWFTVDGEVAVDEAEVLEMRFLLDRLDRAQGRFVPLDNGRFIALTQRLQAQLRQLAAVSEPDKAGRRIHALGSGAVAELVEEAGSATRPASWRSRVAAWREIDAWTPAVPHALQAELRDYQEDGFVWLARLARLQAGACLADDMGLGKTVQAIALMLHRAADGPCLVVAPTSVCPNWASEVARFAPTLTVHPLSAATDRAAMVAGLGAHDVLLCSYGLLQQEADLLTVRPWSTVVLDEAQAIKNAETRRAQAVHRIQAGFRLALTGTPVENDLGELWSLFAFVIPGLLGPREKFQRRFLAGDGSASGAGPGRAALKTLLRPFLLRRTKAAVLSELPPRIDKTVVVEMDQEERVFYEALRQQALATVATLDTQAGQRRIRILAEITRLRRACCNPRLIDAEAAVSSAKLAAFLDLVDELRANRHRALVFSQFVGHLGLIRDALDARRISYQYLDGGTPAAERERRVAAFQAGEAELFLISLRAGGTGLNLTAADFVVHLDPWWNPAVEDQASDRAHRIGQTRSVTVYRLVMQDTIEERIVQLHHDKRALSLELLDDADTTGRITEEQLLALMAA